MACMRIHDFASKCENEEILLKNSFNIEKIYGKNLPDKLKLHLLAVLREVSHDGNCSCNFNNSKCYIDDKFAHIYFNTDGKDVCKHYFLILCKSIENSFQIINNTIEMLKPVKNVDIKKELIRFSIYIYNRRDFRTYAHNPIPYTVDIERRLQREFKNDKIRCSNIGELDKQCNKIEIKRKNNYYEIII